MCCISLFFICVVQNDTFHGVYTFLSPQPYTVYEFQVRCACEEYLISDWSAVHRVETAEAGGSSLTAVIQYSLTIQPYTKHTGASVFGVGQPLCPIFSFTVG